MTSIFGTLKRILPNTEDWWSTLIGLGTFAFCFVISFSSKSDYTTAPIWSNNPGTFFTDSYYWVSIPIAFVVLLFGTYVPLKFMEKRFDLKGFVFIFLLTILCIIIGNQKTFHAVGVGAPVWSIGIGFMFSNIVFRGYHVYVNLRRREGYQTIQDDRTLDEMENSASLKLKETKSIWTEDCIPRWLKCVLLDEYFIKVSLVLLAMDLLKVKDVFVPSIIVSSDTIFLFLFLFVVGWKIWVIDRDTAMVAAAAVSICGSSAANAIGSTIGASKSAISFPIAIMAIWTVPCIVLMPIMYTKWLEDALHWTSREGGAWIGGTIDTTGAVVASAATIDDDAKQAAAIVKMLQNCLIGPICLIVLIGNIYLNREKESDISGKKVLQILWNRFPKFVLGFISVCLILLALPSSDWKTQIINTSLLGSSWFETMGFVCIGLNINITEICNNLSVMKLLVFYLLAQAFDMFTTGLLTNYAF
ncbi:hypothetical protein PPL_12006 [Heterostelium album PN500]|uniref:Uncharacterized protein n=1 Tax=Heterostelium pallidum (strain ATCC 26659 / Pp 5 / PN500) TaxID=670386 RepID=D3BV34_HETP5|nr:hypothetical protein PPL_12006 [Heterostelium album PN500]EFA74972.1 hypothetical protein PPL_12006 [Heterostelium album PN500]|eukprot:XP_020427106.1 hypothetical protein PPL_12006 [Heterostelium album PN500]